MYYESNVSVHHVITLFVLVLLQLNNRHVFQISHQKSENKTVTQKYKRDDELYLIEAVTESFRKVSS